MKWWGGTRWSEKERKRIKVNGEEWLYLCDWIMRLVWDERPVVSLMVCSGFVLAEVLFNGGGFCFGLLVEFVKWFAFGNVLKLILCGVADVCCAFAGRASCKLKQFIMMCFYLYVITFIKQFCSFRRRGYKLVGFWGENTVNVPCFVAKKIKKWRISAGFRWFWT